MAAAVYRQASIEHYPMGFKHLGNGTSSICQNTRYPIIKRSQNRNVTFFLVRAAVACGLEVRNPRHYVRNATLYLSYEAHDTGTVAMCDCEYRSVFTFANFPATVKRVVFQETDVAYAP